MTFQQSYEKIVAVICGVDTGLLNGKRERAMKEETFKNKIPVSYTHLDVYKRQGVWSDNQRSHCETGTGWTFL